MPSTIDPAILRALSLSSSESNIAVHGGSGFASTFRITAPSVSIFIKTSSAPGAAVMFEGEHASLNAIHDAVPSLCPKSFAWGKLDNGGYFLATEFLDLCGGLSGGTRSGKAKNAGIGMSLAEKLAKLHSTPTPIPDGYDVPQFGFPVTTCCGDTPQDNRYTSSWAKFFGERRLLAILEQGEKNNGDDPELRRTVERIVDEVVPKLLGDGHLGGKEGITPVVVHGDLWSGNKSKGRFVGRDAINPDEAGPVEDIIFDASAFFAHNEYDFGIMNMFG